MDYETLLFDIDGTLLDPGDSITESARYALSKFDINDVPEESLRKFVGPPLEHSFRDYYNFDDTQVEQAVSYFREKLVDDGIELYKPYEGMQELVSDLHTIGKQLAIVTSKIDTIARTVLKNADLMKYFEVICAQRAGKTVHKDQILSEALQKLNISDHSKVVMIGDRKHDIDAAKKCSVDSIGILHGYGSNEELTDAKATYVLQDTASLRKLLLH